jgi:hypothetical protein
MAMSLRANVAGSLLAGFACAAIAVLARAALVGAVPHRGYLVAVAWGMILMLAVAVAQWAWRLV